MRERGGGKSGGKRRRGVFLQINFEAGSLGVVLAGRDMVGAWRSERTGRRFKRMHEVG